MPALVLDLGGVVYRSWPDAAFHARWAASLGCEAETLTRHLWGGPEWGSAELGQITPADCYGAVATRLGVNPDLVAGIATRAFASDPDEALAEYVMALRRKDVVVAALTNNIAGEAALMARPELKRLFDLVVSSADVRLQKPDPAIYRLTEERIGSLGSEVVFLDDVETNVRAAAALGWRGILFRSTQQALAELGSAFSELEA